MDRRELLEALGSDDKSTRRFAIAALRAELPEVRDDVLRATEADNPLVRASAASVLDHAEQDAEVQRALVLASCDHDARVRGAALHSLSCGHCKPDGCLSDDAVERLVDALLHDASVRIRRRVAGELMWGQHGRGELVQAAFRQILATDPDRVLRERAAKFLAACEFPRESMRYREWIGAWTRRVEALLADEAA